MKFIRTATTLILMALAYLQAAPVHAQRCSEVCPNEDRPGCWRGPISHRFPSCPDRSKPLHLRSGVCNAWCICNPFGRRCKACGSCNGVSTLALDEVEVDDYSEYMAYSDNEKMVELSDTVCPDGKVAASHELHRALENLADVNGDGFLSREEFENANHDTTDILNEHCIQSYEVEESRVR